MRPDPVPAVRGDRKPARRQAASGNYIEDFLGVPAWEQIVGQRLSYLPTIRVCSIIERRVQVTSDYALRQNFLRDSCDLDFLARFLPVGRDNPVEGLGTKLQIDCFTVANERRLTRLSAPKRRAFPESSKAETRSQGSVRYPSVWSRIPYNLHYRQKQPFRSPNQTPSP